MDHRRDGGSHVVALNNDAIETDSEGSAEMVLTCAARSGPGLL